MYLIVETIIFQEVSLDKKCLVKLILPSSFETGLVLVICLSTKFEPSLTFVWKLSSLKEVTVRTEPHYGVTCSITLFLTGKILRLAQFGSVLRRGGLAQSFGRGVYCTLIFVILSQISKSCMWAKFGEEFLRWVIMIRKVLSSKSIKSQLFNALSNVSISSLVAEISSFEIQKYPQ